MAINLDRVGIYNEQFPSIKSPDPLIMWSSRVMYHIQQGLQPLNLAKW